ncbi:MAG: telomere resolvase [Pleurocapsa sp. MO_192.B19]|nr:telomere resolvase [Pleurocapsa sp. MO_192.B19]
MVIAKVEEFLEKLSPLTTLKDIKILCNQELDYLRKELSIETKFSQLGYPVGVIGDARRLKQQVSIYRKAIRTLETNSKNSFFKIIDGAQVRQHKALRYFNLAEYEKRDVNTRDRARVRQDKSNRKSFDAVAVIDKSIELLELDSYICKVAGLYLLTGRRHEEILVTGQFNTPTSDADSIIGEWLEFDIDSALFSGQVKRKGKTDNPYNIPLLAPLDLVQDTTRWLRINKPHKPGQRPKGSKELGLSVRKVFQDSGLLPIPSGKDEYLNPHNLRSAYSAICWQLYRYSAISQNCTEDIFVKAIMGHTEETTQSAQSYLDYELNNNEVQKLIDRYYE